MQVEPQHPAVPGDRSARGDGPVPADALFEQWCEAMFVLDRRCTVLRANQAASELLCRLGGPGEPAARPLAKLLGLDAPSERRLVGAVCAGRRDAFLAVARGGADLTLTVCPIGVPDGPAAAAVLARDPSAAERLIADDTRGERLAALARFAAGAAHEIRNPLTAVRGFLQLLRADCGEGPAARYLEVVSHEMLRIERIASDLLLLGRAPAEDLEPCDLAGLARMTCELLRQRAAEAGAAIALRVRPGDSVCLAVSERLQQVLLNLVGNAIEAIPPSGGTVRVAVGPGSAPPSGSGAREIEVSVEDEGPGIPAEVLPRIFEPFFTTKAGGTGLGLAVSETIVRGFGGHIAVESPPGRGATFTVRLPAAASYPVSAAPA